MRSFEAEGSDSGNYQRNARCVIEEWISWLSNREESVRNFDQLEVAHMRQYARHLKERVDAGELAGSTANTYWNYIAAFLGWCVYEELVAENPARHPRARRSPSWWQFLSSHRRPVGPTHGDACRRRVGHAVGVTIDPLPDHLMRARNAETLQHGGCFPQRQPRSYGAAPRALSGRSQCFPRPNTQLNSLVEQFLKRYAYRIQELLAL